MRQLLFLVLILSFTEQLVAQKSKKDSTKKAPIQLQEVVVSANRVPESKRYVAQQIEVISSKRIAEIDAPNTGDLLSNSGTLFVQRSQFGGGSPVIRGFESSRILLMVDGVRMNNLIYRAGHLQNIITVDQNILDRVEVGYGPSSVVYGSDALGGVINMYTRNPTFDGMKVSGMVRLATATGERSANVLFNTSTKNGKLASLTSITGATFGDLSIGSNFTSQVNKDAGLQTFIPRVTNSRDAFDTVSTANKYLIRGTGYSQYDIMQKVMFKPSEKVSHLLNFQFSTSTDINRTDRLLETVNNAQGVPLNPRFAEWYYGPQFRLMGMYQFLNTQKTKLYDQMRVTLSYQSIEESRHDRRYNTNLPSSLNHRTENVGVWGLTADFTKQLNSKSDLRYGIDAQLNTLKSTAYAENINTKAQSKLITRYPDGNNTQNHYAAYATYTNKISDKLTALAGLRFSAGSLNSNVVDNSFLSLPVTKFEQSYSTLNYNLGLIWYPVADWKVSLANSSGFRTPNIDDLAKVFESAAGNLVVPNANLKPEKTNTLDLGIAKSFGKVFAETNFFYTSFTDAIVTDKFTLNGQEKVTYRGVTSNVVAQQNKQSAYIWGNSTQVTANINRLFSAYASINYTYGRINKDNGTTTPLDHIPPMYGRLGVRFTEYKVKAELFMNYNSAKRIEDYLLGAEDNEQYALTKDGTPGWATVNLRITTVITPTIHFQIGVDNLADLQYRHFASGINAPGRNIILSLRASL
jgi:hemoglobin/transferrin/lactoferrin receptor protein